MQELMHLFVPAGIVNGTKPHGVCHSKLKSQFVLFSKQKSGHEGLHCPLTFRLPVNVITKVKNNSFTNAFLNALKNSELPPPTTSNFRAVNLLQVVSQH